MFKIAHYLGNGMYLEVRLAPLPKVRIITRLSKKQKQKLIETLAESG